MERKLLTYLKDWLTSANRKPLVIRGPRQVGKTWLVRRLAKITGRKLIELNFEKNPTHISFFSSNDPEQILLNLNTLIEEKIDPKKFLLFLDEIQAVPQLLGKLRWFFEDLPELPVIAAGSLLEFVLAAPSFSIPVGRISYAHLEPLSFEEFLLASHKSSLVNYLNSYNFKQEMPEAIHEQLITLFKEYLLVGGLPAVVDSWVTERSLGKIHQIQHDLLATYRNDFSKYQGRIAIERLDEVMMATTEMLGKKFVFSRVNPSVQSSIIKQALTLLEKARICYRVRSSAANGIPLGAEIHERYFKEVFLDTGLCSAALGLNLNQINMAREIVLINSGGLAEQIVGQILRTIEPPYVEPHLYCWHREESSSNAELDYMIQHGNKVIPIEVKAGSTGGLKSLHLFMALKKLPLAIRVNSMTPSRMEVNVKDHEGKMVNYTLLSIPFYLMEQVHRLLDLNDLE